MKPRSLMFAALFLAAWSALAQETPFKFQPEQRVYVVAASLTSRDLSLTGGNLEIERKAREQFKKEKQFIPTGQLEAADFVFLVLIDESSRHFDELALALRPGDYAKNGANLDALRQVALWQSSGHFKGSSRAKGAALAAGTAGYGALFYHPSVVKGLVKQFQKEVLK